MADLTARLAREFDAHRRETEARLAALESAVRAMATSKEVAPVSAKPSQKSGE